MVDYVTNADVLKKIDHDIIEMKKKKHRIIFVSWPHTLEENND